MTVSCGNCNATNPSDAAYCTECGTRLSMDRPMSTDTEVSGEHESSSGNETTIAALAHILGLLTWIFGPLVIMLVSDDPFVVQNAKNAVMWQLMLAVYGIIAVILILVLVGILMLFVLALLDLVFCIIAAVKASEGETWKYPLTPSV